MIDMQKKTKTFYSLLSFNSRVDQPEIFQFEQKHIFVAKTLLKPSLEKWIIVEDSKNS